MNTNNDDAYYKPSEEEEYMNDKQIQYFKHKLLKWKEELKQEMIYTTEFLKQKNWNEPDLSDRAASEVDVSVELRKKDRYRKLVNKIDDALLRIQKGTYGYCEDTMNPIGLSRLDARPIATLSIEAQEKHESFERNHNED